MGKNKKSYTKIKNISTNIKSKRYKFKTTRRGRIKKNSSKIGKKNKDDPENIIRKFKSKFLLILLEFINNFLEKKGIEEKILKLIGRRAENIATSYNKSLLLLTLKEIFSLEISKKNGKNIPEDHNIKLLNKIYEKDNDIKNLLDLTFEDCLRHFRRTESKLILYGLEKEYDKMIKELSNKNTHEYVEKFKDIVYDFEIIFREQKKILTKDKYTSTNED